MPSLPPLGDLPEQIGRYRVDGVAGAGGMGTVLRATDTVLQRPVALKVIGGSQDPKERGRLVREAKHLAALQHPHVVEVYDVGEAGELAYVAMRWVEGPDLAEQVRREGAFGISRSARVIAEVASALDVAHERGLIHRDVKPANILLCRDDDHALLADFGTTIQQETTHGVTATGDIVATADFAAPEQIEGGALDARADVYGLGCVAFWLLTGRVPFPRDGAVAKLLAQVHEPPPSVRDLRPEVPVELDAAIRRAMAKDPADRFASAGAFATAASAAATDVVDEPTAVAPAVAGPTRRSSRPRRRAAALAALVSLLVAAVAAAGLMLVPGDAGAPAGASTSEPRSSPEKKRERSKKRRARTERKSKRAKAPTAAPSVAPAAPAASPQATPVPERREPSETSQDEEPREAPEPDEEEYEETEPEPEPTPSTEAEPEPTPTDPQSSPEEQPTPGEDAPAPEQ